MITPTKLKVRQAVADYYTVDRRLMQDLTGVGNDRVMRRILQQEVSEGFINRVGMEVVRAGEAPMSVYYPSRKGLDFLVEHTGDERYKNACCLCPNWQHLKHWAEVAKFKFRLDQSAAGSEVASVAGWVGEWQVVNPDEKEPEKRYRLYTLLQEKPKRLVATPDAGFLLRRVSDGRSKVHYLEFDRHTVSAAQICASKPPGYAEMERRGQKHFESTSNSFWVLSVSYTPERRDYLLKTFRKEVPPGWCLWKFAALSELTPEALLHSPVWHHVEAKPGPLVTSAAGPEAVRPTPEKDTVSA